MQVFDGVQPHPYGQAVWSYSDSTGVGFDLQSQSYLFSWAEIASKQDSWLNSDQIPCVLGFVLRKTNVMIIAIARHIPFEFPVQGFVLQVHLRSCAPID